MVEIAGAILDLARRHPDHAFIVPVHPHPDVAATLRPTLGEQRNVALTAPLVYRQFVFLMMNARLILSDSGGIQEEAPTFGVPVLVLRDESERPEAIEAGVATLVGADRDLILSKAGAILRAAGKTPSISPTKSPFGDGLAANRIASHLWRTFEAREGARAGKRSSMSRKQSPAGFSEGQGQRANEAGSIT
jgi:UDP-N-acetylglucosamine 2-epimerase